jgi:hypothetical protein
VGGGGEAGGADAQREGGRGEVGGADAQREGGGGEGKVVNKERSLAYRGEGGVLQSVKERRKGGGKVV